MRVPAAFRMRRCNGARQELRRPWAAAVRTAHGHALLHGADQEAAPGSAAEGRQVCGMRGLAGIAQRIVQAHPAVQVLRRTRCTSSGAACKRCRTGICNSAHLRGQRERAVALSNDRSP